MYDVYLEYSFSDGKYWSKYNHCRVWDNGTYGIIIRDNYGQTSMTKIEVTNNINIELDPPYIETDYVGGTWVSTDVSYTVKTTDPDLDIYKISNGNEQFVGKGQYSDVITSAGYDTVVQYLCKDKYGNKSTPITFTCLIDKTAPTNISYIPTVSIANEIYTTITAINDDSPMRYSISYDDGQTWSKPQIGTNFGLVNNPPKGEYLIKGRAYNAAGLFIEGPTVSVTIV